MSASETLKSLKLASVAWEFHDIIASMELRRPEDYKDVFSILEENRVIPRNLSERLQKMAGFRNLLVHYYTKVDNKTVFSIMREDVRIFPNL